MGIHQLINKSITKSDVDIQVDLYQNIVLSGGNTEFTGLDERLQTEISALTKKRDYLNFSRHISMELSLFIVTFWSIVFAKKASDPFKIFGIKAHEKNAIISIYW